MIRIYARVQDATAKWLEEETKKRKLEVNGQLAVGKFLDLVATWPIPGTTKDEAENVTEKKVYIAEELETADSLLKIMRDEDGIPAGFVRAKSSDAWKKIDWRQLEKLNVEVQGLKRDKLSEEVKRIKATRVKIESRLSASAKHAMDQEQDRAEVPNWCRKDRVSIETRSELEAHKTMCGIGSLEYVVGMPEVRD